MQALALKYRPRNFDELIGQEAVSKSLTHALDDGRISHAYLFSGLRGSGKTSSARIFSKALVCEKGPTSRPCETCTHCVMANESRHMDIIEMDAASHRKIDDIRELIEQTRYAPAAARYKIFIIDEVHMLTKEAFNALLKTLEEPPSYVKFILATTDPLKLPATVLSRTQHFRFKQISKNAIIKHLEFILSKEGLKYEREALEILARSGSGSLRDTLTLLDQAIIYSAQNITQSAVASMLGLLDPARIENILEVIFLRDKARLRELISELESYEPEMIIDELIANLKDKFLLNDPKFSLLIYERFFRILAQAKGMLNATSDNGFVLSIMLFMMIEALNLKGIDEAIDELEGDKKIEAKSQNLSANLAPVKSAEVSINNAPYKIFLEKIYDRDFSLGECFNKCVSFVGFDGTSMRLISKASGEYQNKLRASSKIIMQILRDCFGANAKIQIESNQNLAKSPNQSAFKPENSQISDILKRINAPQNNQENLNKDNLSAKAQILADNGAFNTSTQNLNAQNLDTQNLQAQAEPVKAQNQNEQNLSTQNEQISQAQNLTAKSDQASQISKTQIEQNLQAQIAQAEQNLQTQNLSEQTQAEQVRSAQNNQTIAINFNTHKSADELKKLENERIIREANNLFGEPQILKE